METARPDAIFRDPFAERLAGERGLEIVRELKRGPADGVGRLIVRTAVLDEMILDRVRNGGVDTVINLAAGLDTRAWRLDLPRSLRWFDIDLPEMVALQGGSDAGRALVCQYEAIAADLTSEAARAEVLRRVGGVSRTALVVTEGLLVYLGDEKVASLRVRCTHVPSIKWWISDIGSPRLLEILNKQWGKAVAAGNAPFLFAPADSPAFFARLAGVRSSSVPAWRRHIGSSARCR